MGELRGRPDQPPEQPDKPAEADAPDPSWNKTQDGTFWRVIRESDDKFAMPGEPGLDRSRLRYEKPSPEDRPAERPLNGEELVEGDKPNPTLLDRARKKAADKEFMGDLLDVADKGGKAGGDFMLGPLGSGKAEVAVPSPVHWEAPQHPAPDGGQALTGMLVVGMMIGHGVMKAHRILSKETGNA